MKAPEGEEHTEATDWFTVGCLIYYMAYGCSPLEYEED
jgi:hypothetical protein